MMLVHFKKAGALDEQAVASGQDAVDVKHAVHAGDSGVISALSLILSNQLDQGLLHRIAARVLGYQALNRGAASRSLRSPRRLRDGAAGKQKNHQPKHPSMEESQLHRRKLGRLK